MYVPNELYGRDIAERNAPYIPAGGYGCHVDEAGRVRGKELNVEGGKAEAQAIREANSSAPCLALGAFLRAAADLPSARVRSWGH